MLSGDFANQTKQSDPSLETIYGFERKRTLYIYPLANLYQDNTDNSLKFSQNIVKIGFIDSEKVKEATAYETSDFNIQLTTEMSTNPQDNTTEYKMTDTKIVIFQNQDFIDDYGLKVVSINQPITNDNLDQLYIIKVYNEPYSPDGITVTKLTTLQRLTDFKTRDGNAIIPILQKPLANDVKITSLKITAPRSALFGNIKVLGKIDGMEVYPKLLLKDKIAFPLLSMPIETQPKVRILEQWFSEQILPWSLAKQFIEAKSVLDLIKIDSGTETRKEVINNARVTNFFIGEANEINKPNWPLSGSMQLIDKEVYLIGTAGASAVYIATDSNFKGVEIEIQDAPTIDSLQKVLLNMLTYSYNYNRNFDGAVYKDGAPDNDIAKLRQKFEGQKPDEVINNLFNEWKLDYPSYVDLPQVQIFKQIVVMLSKYIYSNMSINKGMNDDNKVLLPYYFELVSKPIHTDEGKIWEFKDVQVKINSLYFNFDNLNIKNNDLSSNQLFKLDDNQFNWLSINKELESNQIPSLIPGDLTLANGEYGKYFTKAIIDKSKIETVLNLYGMNKSQLYSKLDWYQEISKIDSNTEFELEIEIPLSQLNRIEISGIFADGNYSIKLVSKEKEISINNISLFSNFNESISYINLEI